MRGGQQPEFQALKKVMMSPESVSPSKLKCIEGGEVAAILWCDVESAVLHRRGSWSMG